MNTFDEPHGFARCIGASGFLDAVLSEPVELVPTYYAGDVDLVGLGASGTLDLTHDVAQQTGSNVQG